MSLTAGRARRSPRWRWSSSTAGGWRRAGPGQRDLAGRDAGLRRLWDALPAHASSPPRAATSACPTGRWATPRSATSTSAPARSSSRTWRGSTTRSPTAASSRTRRCCAACERARRSPRGRLHLLGLVSDGGVHSGWEHIEAAIELAAQEGVPDLVVHAFTDGRDTLPHGGRGLPRGARALAARRRAAIGTVSGRYYAMDRDTPLGADQARLRRDRPRPGPARARAPPRRSRRPTSAARPTSSSSRR